MKHPLGIRVDSPVRVWLFVFVVTLCATFAAVLTVAFVLWLTAMATPPLAYLIAGAVPLLIMPPVTYVLAQMAYELTSAQDELFRLARTDDLTELNNRRAFFEEGNRLLAETSDTDAAVGLLLIDADNFKQVNDSLGHAAGDHALRHLAQSIVACCHVADFVARFGGDEFAVLRRNATVADMAALAQAIQLRLVAHPFTYDRAAFALTISTGVADSLTYQSFDSLLLATDIALYDNKGPGRTIAPPIHSNGEYHPLPLRSPSIDTPLSAV
jgi:diguanylate cyclase (GGDEF)-like protein